MDHNLRDILMPMVILGTCGGVIILFVKTLTDYILKKKLIERGLVNAEAQTLFKQQASEDNKYTSLKWGLIIFFGGLSLIIIEYVPHDRESPLPYGIFSLAVSLGFLIYYFIVKNDSATK